MVRKVFKSGNSLVVALPPEALTRLALVEGSEVEVSLDTEGHGLRLTPVAPAVGGGITPEYAQQVADFIAAYRPALEELARR